MTEKSFEEAKKILNKIEHVKQLRSWLFHSLLIKSHKDDRDYMYLSWADNEDGELKNIMIAWCDEEIKRLQARFDEL